MKIAVLGYIVRGPLGGMVWHHFQYVYGLYLMGHDVLFLEDSGDYPSCYNPQTFQTTIDPSFGLKFIDEFFSKFDFKDKWSYYDFHTEQWFGKSSQEVFKFLNEADILLNISGINPLRHWVKKIPKIVFIDSDPVFVQTKHLINSDAKFLASEHNVFLTFGENFGKDGCTIPDDGFDWKPTRQPVVTALWKSNTIKQNGRWTTVMQWDSYKTLDWNEKHFGMKSKSFQSFINLPKKLTEKFELALGSDSAPKEELTNKGWYLIDPLYVTRTPESYQEYISDSKGEWSVAKHGYVITKSGWFSERSTAYLASGKPVVLQDTGYSQIIPTGEGLFNFNNHEELADIFANINGNYNLHCRKSREICSEYFEYQKVLNRLIDDL